MAVEDEVLYQRLYEKGKKRARYFDGERYRYNILKIINNNI